MAWWDTHSCWYCSYYCRYDDDNFSIMKIICLSPVRGSIRNGCSELFLSFLSSSSSLSSSMLLFVVVVVVVDVVSSSAVVVVFHVAEVAWSHVVIIVVVVVVAVAFYCHVSLGYYRYLINVVSSSLFLHQYGYRAGWQPLCVCVCCITRSVCVCVCVCARARSRALNIHPRTLTEWMLHGLSGKQADISRQEGRQTNRYIGTNTCIYRRLDKQRHTQSVWVWINWGRWKCLCTDDEMLLCGSPR